MKKTRQRKRRSKFEFQVTKRLYIFLFIFMISLSYVGFYKVYNIKYVHGEEYEAKAIYNQVNKVQDKIINPNRGAILDRNKQALAISSTVYNVILDVRVLNTLEQSVKKNTFDGLKSTLEFTDEQLQEFMKLDENGNLVNDTNWLVIKKEVPFEQGKKLQELNLKCVYTEEDTKRTYPHNTIAAQVVGFIRGDSKWGLESQYNDYMLGVPGRVFRTYEADNSIVTRQEAPKEGNSIITTIDQTIQQFAEDEVKKWYKEYNPKNAGIIVMNPKTGEILAMADYPGFDLNDPSQLTRFEDKAYKEKYDKLSEEEKMNEMFSAWKNFNITDTFEPGSIFKPEVVAAALEEGVISVNDTFYCGGYKKYGSEEPIHCHKRSGHGTQTLTQVLANSCNVGMMEIVEKLGREKFYKYQRDFGFGEKTGIDLPGEVGAENLLYPVDKLNVIELATSSFGQSFNCTSLQALNGLCAVINGGNLMRPYIVSQITDKDGTIIKENSPKIVRKVISSETSDYMRKAMENVIEEGTGKKAVIKGYKIGGKTGTAQQNNRKLNKDYTLSFIAYLPIDDPEIAAISIVHLPDPYEDGVTSAVPMMRELLLKIINYKSIPPSSEIDESEITVNTENETILNDYTGKSLQETIKELNSLGIEFELAGSGGDIITKQFPAGKSKIDKNTKILLYISPSSGEKELINIPNVVGMPSSNAQDILKSAGFECNVIEEIPDETTEETTKQETEANENTETKTQETNDNLLVLPNEKLVVEQIPASEVKVEKGTIVKIKIK